MKVDWSLDGKVAIVTGASKGGIGEAYAQTLAGAGASVVCADMNADGASTVAADITGAGGSALAVEVDIADEASVASMVEAATKQFGGVDILVNNAGLMVQIVMNTAMGFSRDEWDRALAVNLTRRVAVRQGGRALDAGARRRPDRQPGVGRRVPAEHRLRHHQARPRRPHHDPRQGARPARDHGELHRPGHHPERRGQERHAAGGRVPPADRGQGSPSGGGRAERAVRHPLALLQSGRCLDHRAGAQRRRRMGDAAVSVPTHAEFDHSTDPALLADHSAEWTRLQAEQGAFRSEIAGEYDLWYLLRHDDINEALRDTELFSSRTVQYLGETMQTLLPEELDPPEHGKYRRLLNASLSPGAVAKLEPEVRGAARRSSMRWQRRGSATSSATSGCGSRPRSSCS